MRFRKETRSQIASFECESSPVLFYLYANWRRYRRGGVLTRMAIAKEIERVLNAALKGER